jgi:uroporphyrinogen-III synthase
VSLPGEVSLPLEVRRVLEGKRVLVTRAAHQAGQLSEGLRALGAEPVEVPVLEIAPPDDFGPLDNALHALGSYDWLVLTSANAVKALEKRAALLGVALGAAAPKQVAVVGTGTEAAARHVGLAVTLVPERFVAESLVENLLCEAALKGHGFSRADESGNRIGALAPESTFSGQRILLARAAVARDVIPDALRAAGASVDVVDAYRNVMPEYAPALLRAALEKGIDAATFTSSSSALHLAEAARAAGLSFPFAGVAAISIGPITSQMLREARWEPAVEADPHDIPGLIAAVARWFDRT